MEHSPRSRHCALVLLSIQIGLSVTEKAPASCAFNEEPDLSPRSFASAPVFQYALPCCWPLPLIAATRHNGNPFAFI